MCNPRMIGHSSVSKNETLNVSDNEIIIANMNTVTIHRMAKLVDLDSLKLGSVIIYRFTTRDNSKSEEISLQFWDFGKRFLNWTFSEYQQNLQNDQNRRIIIRGLVTNSRKMDKVLLTRRCKIQNFTLLSFNRKEYKMSIIIPVHPKQL